MYPLTPFPTVHRRLVFTIPDIHLTASYDILTVKLIMPAELLMQIACMAADVDRTTVSRELIALEPRNAN